MRPASLVSLAEGLLFRHLHGAAECTDPGGSASRIDRIRHVVALWIDALRNSG